MAVLVAEEQPVLVAELDDLGVEHQINYRKDGLRYVAIYAVDALRTILERLGPQLTSERRDALDLLVRARGPIPDEIVEAIRHRHYGSGWNEQQIATAMNEKPIIDGMGKGWTRRKIRRILAEN